MTGYIYGLADPRTGDIRYVGLATSLWNLHRRYASHCRSRTDGSHSFKASWLRSIGCDPRLVVLEETDDLATREIWWIAQGRRWGWRLTNLTDGGDGTPGLVQTEEHKRRVSEALRGKKRKPFSAEHRQNLSVAHQKPHGRKMTPEHIEAIQAGRRRAKARRLAGSEV